MLSNQLRPKVGSRVVKQNLKIVVYFDRQCYEYDDKYLMAYSKLRCKQNITNTRYTKVN